eukprot:gene1253-1417_t
MLQKVELFIAETVRERVQLIGKELNVWVNEYFRATVLVIETFVPQLFFKAFVEYGTSSLLQDVVASVGECVSLFEGTVIGHSLATADSLLTSVCFGVASCIHPNDCVRGTLAGVLVCARLSRLGIRAAVGVASDLVMYHHILSDARNISVTTGAPHRIAQRLSRVARSLGGGVVVDERTAASSQPWVVFTRDKGSPGKSDGAKEGAPRPSSGATEGATSDYFIYRPRFPDTVTNDEGMVEGLGA